MDTIVALATARGRAGVAVIRVSGEAAWTVCERICGRVPPERVATLSAMRDADGRLIDRGLVLVFDAGRSFTGEKVCEFQVHGSIAVVSAMIAACLAVEGVRAAEPGEFTRRAFISGRMDLTEVEALADLIDAETEAQRRMAVQMLDGSAGRLVDAWRQDLLEALAMLEAAMDFADEELPEDLTEHVRSPLLRLVDGLRSQLAGRKAAEAVREGFEVAIVGKVNAGKSTLLNALARRDAAITSERAGTTRDVIEVRMDIDGVAVTLIDTAGLRATEDEIEKIGIERGMQRASQADLRICLLSEPEEEPPGIVGPNDIILLSKADLWGLPGVSGKTGEGVEKLVREISSRLVSLTRESPVFTRERHFDKLDRAAICVESVLEYVERGDTCWELASEQLRDALRCLDGIVGRVDVEDVLGRIFSSFCIGK
ncbi:MAG: tRNA uridine-5-carboxymethylaminomethyl(34) synthesis GTPase MnmE [Alphaproteobacteria bacterium]|nr:MAG: tRNA uridine-5-carboxymethylaminomethyl(34) synthesis GTPase MnmE [Alphaproteobacteria bacterium]